MTCVTEDSWWWIVEGGYHKQRFRGEHDPSAVFHGIKIIDIVKDNEVGRNLFAHPFLQAGLHLL